MHAIVFSRIPESGLIYTLAAAKRALRDGVPCHLSPVLRFILGASFKVYKSIHRYVMFYDYLSFYLDCESQGVICVLIARYRRAIETSVLNAYLTFKSNKLDISSHLCVAFTVVSFIESSPLSSSNASPSG